MAPDDPQQARSPQHNGSILPSVVAINVDWDFDSVSELHHEGRDVTAVADHDMHDWDWISRDSTTHYWMADDEDYNCGSISSSPASTENGEMLLVQALTVMLADIVCSERSRIPHYKDIAHCGHWASSPLHEHPYPNHLQDENDQCFQSGQGGMQTT